jgi:DNA-binding CsgD family transcriptional regulator
MRLIKTILGITDLDELIGFQAGLDNPDITTFVKDIEGKYLSCNSVMASHFGCKSVADILGMTDYEFHPKTIATIARENDSEVILSNSSKIYSERFKSLSGNDEEMVATSLKTPLRYKQKIIGMIGFAIIHSHNTLLLNAKEHYNLTKKQLDCLLLLVKGKPMKLIAVALSISPRTVEHYLEAIKFKLDCTNKSQLIEKALCIPYIKTLL